MSKEKSNEGEEMKFKIGRIGIDRVNEEKMKIGKVKIRKGEKKRMVKEGEIGK